MVVCCGNASRWLEIELPQMLDELSRCSARGTSAREETLKSVEKGWKERQCSDNLESIATAEWNLGLGTASSFFPYKLGYYYQSTPMYVNNQLFLFIVTFSAIFIQIYLALGCR